VRMLEAVDPVFVGMPDGRDDDVSVGTVVKLRLVEAVDSVVVDCELEAHTLTVCVTDGDDDDVSVGNGVTL
jgi:hypothetical protein